MNTPQTTSTGACSVPEDAPPTDAPATSPVMEEPDARPALPGLPCGRLELALLALLYLLVVGLVLIAALMGRFRSPELFAWGQRLLSQERGLWMTAVLPVGGLALVAAMQFARRGLHRWSIVALLVTVLSGGVFLTVGAIDYDSKAVRRLVPGKRFRPDERYVARRFGVRLPRDWNTRSATTPAPVMAVAAAVPVKRQISATNGRDLFLRVCASCHGSRGEGIIGSGKELRVNEFVASRDDAAIADFLKVGRQPWDPENTTKVQMPGRGGDPRVTDEDLRDVVAYLRELQSRFAERSAASSEPGPAIQPAAGATVAAGQSPTSLAVDEPPTFIVHRSYIPDAPPGPRGLSPAYTAKLTRPRWAIPDKAQEYFGMFFVLTGFGGLHVLAAWFAVVAALITVLRRHWPNTIPRPLFAATAAWWWATGCWALVYGLIYV